jgi:hypothetical protein
VYIREACDIKSFNYHHRYTFFSFSLLQKLHPKTFKTLSNGGLYDQLECHDDQANDISYKAEEKSYFWNQITFSFSLQVLKQKSELL